MKAVIDTNVLLVANKKHKNVSRQCVCECVRRLVEMEKHGVVVIDDAFLVLTEYLQKTSPNQPKGAGDVFLKWLLRNSSNPKHVSQVKITPASGKGFAEFPDSDGAKAALKDFDSSDRKFVAISNAHPDKPVIWQASDGKWLNWHDALNQAGIHVDFLCPDDECRFFASKFPDKATPAFCTARNNQN